MKNLAITGGLLQLAAFGPGAFSLAWRLPNVPSHPAVSVARHLAPLADGRVVLTLLTTWLAYTGLFLVYTYIIAMALLVAEWAQQRIARSGRAASGTAVIPSNAAR